MRRQHNGMGYFKLGETFVHPTSGALIEVLEDNFGLSDPNSLIRTVKDFEDLIYVQHLDNVSNYLQNTRKSYYIDFFINHKLQQLAEYKIGIRNPDECPLKVGDKVRIHKEITQQDEIDGNIGFIPSSMSKWLNTEQIVSEVNIINETISKLGLFSFRFEKCTWNWSPNWATKVTSDLIDITFEISNTIKKATKGPACPRIECELFKGIGVMGSVSFDFTNPCPKCGFPGLLPKVGWCQHKRLRMGYTGKIVCLADDCGAEFKCTSTYILKPNTIFHRVKHRTHSILDPMGFYATLDLKQNKDHKALLENLYLVPLNDLAKPPANGWIWPKSTDDISF